MEEIRVKLLEVCKKKTCLIIIWYIHRCTAILRLTEEITKSLIVTDSYVLRIGFDIKQMDEKWSGGDKTRLIHYLVCCFNIPTYKSFIFFNLMFLASFVF